MPPKVISQIGQHLPKYQDDNWGNEEVIQGHVDTQSPSCQIV